MSKLIHSIFPQNIGKTRTHSSPKTDNDTAHQDMMASAPVESKGIGKATALRLAKDGANVIINYASDAAPADELVKTIGSARALAVQAKAATIAGIDKMVKQTIDKFGKIDILIPCAGVMFMEDLEKTAEEDLTRPWP
ncbi:MAG: hypothetical protein Q9211_004384 [Gyalolechia sp. 1 TL-2023]